MALNTLKCNRLKPPPFKGLRVSTSRALGHRSSFFDVRGESSAVRQNATSCDWSKWAGLELYMLYTSGLSRSTGRVNTIDNKSAQSNLGRGPRRGVVAYIRRKVLICYNGAPQIRP